MKRHMKLIFLILDYVERTKNNGVHIPAPEFDDYTRTEVAYHVRLCHEAGYLIVPTKVTEPDEPAIKRMTWKGHEELDRMRKEGCNKPK